MWRALAVKSKARRIGAVQSIFRCSMQHEDSHAMLPAEASNYQSLRVQIFSACCRGI